MVGGHKAVAQRGLALCLRGSATGRATGGVRRRSSAAVRPPPNTPSLAVIGSGQLFYSGAKTTRCHSASLCQLQRLRSPFSSSASSSWCPVIDIAPLIDPTSSLKARRQVGQALHESCVNVGFFYIKNTGVPEDLRQRALHLAEQFFSLPEEAKQSIAISTVSRRMCEEAKARGATPPLSCRGYQKVGENVTKYARDLHEAIDMYREHEGEGEGFGGTNPWVEEDTLPGFRQMFEHDYVQSMLGLGNAVMRGMALGFDLREDYFQPFYDRSFWCMRIIRYPPVSPEDRASLAKGLGCGEHSDYGCLTILNTDGSKEALQAQSVDGQWRFADPIPGCFIVNVGDMLSRWSNGKFRSTPHRVLPAVGKPRLSIPFFFEPNLDTLVEPLPSCSHYTQGRVFESVRFADHLRAKVSNNFSFYDGDTEVAAATPKNP